MLRRAVRAVYDEFSPTRAMRLLRGLAGFHRVPGSGGLEGAAGFLAGWLAEHGVEARVRRYPADGKTECYSFVTVSYTHLTLPTTERV